MPLYSALESAKDEFRVIRFVGGSRDLAWELETVSIHDDQPWVALSYCWGQSEATKSITLNGEEFLVRPNLYGFLVQMASENRRDRFFVDAICINQTDLSERAAQVGLMGQIYRKADEAIAWVHMEGFKDLKQTQAEMESNLRYIQNLKKQSEESGQELTPEDSRLVTSMVDMIKGLALSSDYWSRLWIVQEILLARKLTIRWYSLTIEWSDILTLDVGGAQVPSIKLDSSGRPLRPHALSTARKANLFEYTRLSGMGENALMCKQLWYWKQSAGSDLQVGKLLAFHEAVEFFSIQNCWMAHDSVFGLLGIANCHIRADYNLSLIELYTATLYNCLLSLWSGKNLDAAGSKVTSDEMELLKKLGLEYPIIRSIGETLMFAFKLEPFDEIVYLASYEVCKRFMPGREEQALVGLASNWLMLTSYVKHDAGSTEIKDFVKQRWYENQSQALKRFHRDLQSRLRHVDAKLEAVRKGDRELTAPGEGGQTCRYSAWVGLIGSVCDEIWKRELEENPSRDQSAAVQ